MKKLLPILVMAFLAAPAFAQPSFTSRTITHDGGSSNDGVAFSALGDWFGILDPTNPNAPFSIMDQSAGSFPGDALGIIAEGSTDLVFGVTDTENPDNTGPVTAVWVFDISSAGTLTSISVDAAAMGDFEGTDLIDWSWDIDGTTSGSFFQGRSDGSASHIYTMEDGITTPSLNDPMYVDIDADDTNFADDLLLDNNFKTLTYNGVSGMSGNTLTITLTTETNGGSEAYCFDNLVVTAALGSVTDDMSLLLLPVELTSFSGIREDESVKLSWNTATESNNDFFAVERSSNGVDFMEVGQVDGSGTTAELRSYNFVDEYPVSGTNYYRLRQVDFNGAFEYSNLVEIEFAGADPAVTIYPNPVTDVLHIMPSYTFTDAKILITDLAGKIVFQTESALVESGTAINTETLPNGMYLLSIEVGNKKVVKKFFK